MQDKLSLDGSRLICFSETDADWVFEVFKRAIPLAQLVEVLWVTSEDELLSLPKTHQRSYVISAYDRAILNSPSLVEVTKETVLIEYLVTLTKELGNEIWMAEFSHSSITSEANSKNNPVLTFTDNEWSDPFGSHFNDQSSAQNEYPPQEHLDSVDATPPLQAKDCSGVIIAVLGPRGSGVTTVSTTLASQLAKVAQTVLVELTIDTDLGFLHDVDDHTPSLSEFFAQNNQMPFSNRRKGTISDFVCTPKGAGYDLVCGIWAEEHVGLIDGSSLQDLLSQLQASYRYVVCDIHPHLDNAHSFRKDGSTLVTDAVLRSASHLCLVTQNGSKWLYALAKIIKKITHLEELPRSWSVTINQSAESKAKSSRAAKEVTQIIQLSIVGSKYEDVEISLHRLAKRVVETIPPEPSPELSSLATKIRNLPAKTLNLKVDTDHYINIAEIY